MLSFLISLKPAEAASYQKEIDPQPHGMLAGEVVEIFHVTPLLRGSACLISQILLQS